MRPYTLSVLASLALVCMLSAQSPMPVTVPAANSAASKVMPTSSTNSNSAILQMLQEMKSANEETLRKQAAALEQLDELEKLADQIRINTRRS